MKLELKHLAPYLPYELKYAILSDDDNDTYYIDPKHNTIGVGGNQSNVTNICLVEYSKPIYKILLRPLSDLFNGDYEDILDEFSEVSLEAFKLAFLSKLRPLNTLDKINYTIANKLFEHHFDLFGLIEEGLAIDVNQL